MQGSVRIGLALLVFAAGAAFAASSDFGPPPVILDLGPVTPTPAPTPKRADRKRLVSTITVQNSAKGDSVISFEAMDVSALGGDRFPLVAAKTYSLSQAAETDDPRAKQLAAEIVTKIRELERDMLRYVEIAGPPKEREPLVK